MTFATGMVLIDAPASALNNSGEKIAGARLQDNTSATKYIQTFDGKTYVYVSAQAVRYWLRRRLEAGDIEWQYLAPYREDKIAYTDGNPIIWWDDDLLGYMRASDNKDEETKAIEKGFTARTSEKGRDGKQHLVTITRASPFRLSTFVSTNQVRPTTDFGVMTRHEGDPVPFEHHFYRATLQGLFSLDLGMAGKFYYQRRTGFQNLDEVRRQIAEKQGLQHLADEKAYRLPVKTRLQRVRSLLTGLGQLEGGAKQAIHYTDVSPAVVITAVTKGGNHPFNYLFDERRSTTSFNEQVLIKALEYSRDQGELLSPVYIGWKPGFLPESAERAKGVSVENLQIEFTTPRDAFHQVATWLEGNVSSWDK